MSFNTAHLIETMLLLLAAYLAGCVLGYALRRILHAARGTRQVSALTPAAATASREVLRQPSPAARLAATVQGSDPAPALAVRKPAPSRQPGRPKSTDPRPLPLGAPRNGTADDLKQIKGIGPKIEASLNGLGVFHIEQIADWTKPNIDWVDGQLAFKGRIRRERWVEQANELVKTAA